MNLLYLFSTVVLLGLIVAVLARAVRMQRESHEADSKALAELGRIHFFGGGSGIKFGWDDWKNKN